MSLSKPHDQSKSQSNKSPRSKNKDNNKKRKAEDSASDEEKSKSIKKANVAFDNSMDLHIYTVRESTSDFIDLQDPLFSDVMPSTLSADNLISMDPVPYRTPHRGWCRCGQCYTRHKEEQLLYESDSSSDHYVPSIIERLARHPGDHHT